MFPQNRHLLTRSPTNSAACFSNSPRRRCGCKRSLKGWPRVRRDPAESQRLRETCRRQGANAPQRSARGE